MLTEEQFLDHHEDNTMDAMDIKWVWVDSPGKSTGYWIRDAAYEALKAATHATHSKLSG